MAGDNYQDFYGNMQAFSENDKDLIKAKILDICGTVHFFNESLTSVGVRSDVGVWTLAFCLYLEVLSFLVAVPVDLVTVVMMFPFALIPCPCGS